MAERPVVLPLEGREPYPKHFDFPSNDSARRIASGCKRGNALARFVPVRCRRTMFARGTGAVPLAEYRRRPRRMVAAAG